MPRNRSLTLWTVPPRRLTIWSCQTQTTAVRTHTNVPPFTFPADTVRAFARGLESRLFSTCTDERCAALRSHVLFGATPLHALSPWLQDTLNNWTSARDTLHVVKPGKIDRHMHNTCTTTNTLCNQMDGSSPRSVWTPGLAGYPSAFRQTTPCRWSPSPTPAPLVRRWSPGRRCSCRPHQRAAVAARRCSACKSEARRGSCFTQASGNRPSPPTARAPSAIFPSRWVWSQPRVDQHHLPAQIPITMVPHQAGEQLLKEMGSQQVLQATFGTSAGPGYYLGIVGSRVRQLGWPVLPTLSHLVWEAQWQEYLAALQTKLDVHADVVTVFDGTQVLEERCHNIMHTSPEDAEHFRGRHPTHDDAASQPCCIRHPGAGHGLGLPGDGGRRLPSVGPRGAVVHLLRGP